MAKAFTRGGYSFRPGQFAGGGQRFFEVHRKGTRDRWASSSARIVEATDGKTWCVSVAGLAYDARPSFAEACDLVMARLPREGA